MNEIKGSKTESEFNASVRIVIAPEVSGCLCCCFNRSNNDGYLVCTQPDNLDLGNCALEEIVYKIDGMEIIDEKD